MTPKHQERALVTGAAGAIAGAILARLDARGYRTTLLDLPSERLDQAASRLINAERTVAVDLSTSDGIQEACEVVRAQGADLDLLVNCAGVIQVRSVTWQPWTVPCSTATSW